MNKVDMDSKFITFGDLKQKLIDYLYIKSSD